MSAIGPKISPARNHPDAERFFGIARQPHANPKAAPAINQIANSTE